MPATGRLRHLRGSALRQARFAQLRGDPGFFSKLRKLSLKKIIKGVAPVAGLIPGIGGPIATLGGLIGAGPALPGAGAPLGIPLTQGQYNKQRRQQLGLRPSSGGLHGLPLGDMGMKKHRRMNVLNPKALRRSMRRVEGFAHFARKTIAFTHHVKMKKTRGGRR